MELSPCIFANHLDSDTWQAVASSLSGFVAKEGIVSTMGVLSGLGEVEEYAASMHDQFAAVLPNGNCSSVIPYVQPVRFTLSCSYLNNGKRDEIKINS